MSETAIWQDLEFGSYRADLPLWEELAAEGSGPTLELGPGAGRVTLHLARKGLEMIGVERDEGLTKELQRRADAEELPVRTVCADLGRSASLELPATPGAAIAPLHVVQQLDPDLRPALLSRLADLLPSGARLAVTLVDENSLFDREEAEADASPDMRDVNGWVYSGTPLWVLVGEEALTIRRLRERVSPAGDIERGVDDQVVYRIEPEVFEREAAEAGFSPAGRREIDSGPGEADSIAVIVEAP